MSNTNNGGPAFARPASEAHQHGMHAAQQGMTLRDYFAAKAVAGLLANHTLEWDIDQYTKYGYKVADAMLKAREA